MPAKFCWAAAIFTVSPNSSQKDKRMQFDNYPHLSWIIIAIVVFFLIRLAVGYYASRKVSTAADYVVAGRRLPIYLTGASIMATWFAAETLMGASATAYQWGFQGVLFDPFGSVLCLLLSGFFFIRVMRRARYMTAIDFFEKRFGKGMALAGAISQMIAYFGWTAAQIVAGGAIVQALLGWPLWVGMLFVAAVVILYTMMGGMWADTLLDFMQMFFTAGGILLIFWVVMKQVGGWDVFTQQGAAALYVSDAFAMLPLKGEGYLGYSGHMGWFYWLAAWMAVGLGSLPAQDLMQRSMSAKNEATAVHGTYLAGILYGVFGILSPLVGIAMFKIAPNLAPEQTEYLVIFAALEYLHPLLAGIFVAALASALMSTSDSSILAGASIFTENVLPMIKKDLSENQQLRWTRIMVALIGLISLLIALFASTIYKLAIFAWTVLLVGQVVPFVLGIYWKKANRSGALWSFAAGFGSWLAALFIYLPTTLEACAGEFEVAVWDAAYIASVPAVIAALITMVAVSLLTQKKDPPLPLADVDGAPLPMKHRLGILPPKDIF
ncbi:MAG: sodium:solute symporter family protein [Anaerolineaceae bacterium]|nr:sodium:solute symporter family protein [Anaerolineaceae bacterium]